MSNVTVKDLFDLGDKIQELEAVYKEEKAKLDVLGAEIDSLFNKATEFLDELALTSFKTPHGTFVIRETQQVKVPATDEDKEQLFIWLKERGIFERYATVNSKSLNSLYNAEYEEALKQGEDMIIWTIPGIGQSKVYRTTSMRKT